MKKTWQVQERLTKSVIPHSFNKDLRSGNFQNVAGTQVFIIFYKEPIYIALSP